MLFLHLKFLLSGLSEDSLSNSRIPVRSGISGTWSNPLPSICFWASTCIKGDMSRKYLVLTRVDGKLRMLSLTLNFTGRKKILDLSRRMLKQLYRGKEIRSFVVHPWPEAPARGQDLLCPVPRRACPIRERNFGILSGTGIPARDGRPFEPRARQSRPGRPCHPRGSATTPFA